MRYHALACDYDGTLALHGHVDESTIAALELVRSSGRRLLLVSGRQLDDLAAVFPHLHLFDRLVVENGALVHDPATGTERVLGPPPEPGFLRTLEQRGVRPLSSGKVIVATWEPHESTVLGTIRDLGLELQVIFNKGAVMVLPTGLNKAAGLSRALDELGLSAHNVVGVGDAENDHAFLALCECAVAVANALPTVKERADRVTAGDHGAGVRELIDDLLRDDLRSLQASFQRHAITLGVTSGDLPVTVPPFAPPVLIAGTSGAGKSTLAISLLEQLTERRYQFCIIDPEGDYDAVEGLAHLGDVHHAPAVEELLEALARPDQSAAVNLLGVGLADRPAYAAGLLARLGELRSRTGRPHWILIDEAHHLLPEALDADAAALLPEPFGLLLLTVHPESVSPQVLRSVGTVVAIGSRPRETLQGFARAIGVEPPEVQGGPLAPGSGVVWHPAGSVADGVSAERRPLIVELRAPSTEHQRHVRKYATGELAPEQSFYFRGADGRLNLRARNLKTFLELAEGVDDETWSFHLARGDYSQWFRELIKDDDLAAECEAIERDGGLAPAESRERVREAVQRRYTSAA